MGNIVFYDFMTFMLPGGTAVLSFLWVLQTILTLKFTTSDYPNELLLVIAITPAYIIGQLFNELGIILERKRSANNPSILISVMNMDLTLAHKLNEISIEYFGFPFIEKDKTAENFIEDKCDRFYTLAYETLEVEGEIEKIKVLFAQYKFLNNMIPLCCWILLCAFVVFFADLFKHQSPKWYISQIQLMAILIGIAAVVFGLISKKLASKRIWLKMNSTLTCFFAFYNLKKTFK